MFNVIASTSKQKSKKIRPILLLVIILLFIVVLSGPSCIDNIMFGRKEIFSRIDVIHRGTWRAINRIIANFVDCITNIIIVVNLLWANAISITIKNVYFHDSILLQQ